MKDRSIPQENPVSQVLRRAVNQRNRHNPDARNFQTERRAAAKPESMHPPAYCGWHHCARLRCSGEGSTRIHSQEARYRSRIPVVKVIVRDQSQLDAIEGRLAGFHLLLDRLAVPRVVFEAVAE